MSRLNVQENNITFDYFEENLQEVYNGDELGVYPISFVFAMVNGQRYLYPNHFLASFVWRDEIEEEIFFTSSALCEEFIDNIKSFGSINLKKWILIKE